MEKQVRDYAHAWHHSRKIKTGTGTETGTENNSF